MGDVGLVNVGWVWFAFVSGLVGGGIGAWCAYMRKANEVYARGRREGWQARMRWEKEHQMEIVQAVLHDEFVSKVGQ